MTTTITKNNKKWVLYITILFVVTILVLGYFQLNKKNYRDEIVAWLNANQITYKNLLVTENGHFKITDAEVSFSDHAKITTPIIEGDMSQNTGTEIINVKDVNFSIWHANFYMANVDVVKAKQSSSLKDEPYMQNMHPFVKSLFKTDIAEINIPKIELLSTKEALSSNSNDENSVPNRFSLLINDLKLNDINNGFIKNSSVGDTKVDWFITIGSPNNLFHFSYNLGKTITKDINYNAIMTFLLVPAQDKKELLNLVGEQTTTDLEYSLTYSLSSPLFVSQSMKTSIKNAKSSPISFMQLDTPIMQWEFFSKNGIENLANDEDKLLKFADNYLDLINAIQPFSMAMDNIKTVSNSANGLLGQEVVIQTYDEASYSFDGNGLNQEINNLKYSFMVGDTSFLNYSLDNLSLKNFRIPNLIENTKQLINDYQTDKAAFKDKFLIDDLSYELILKFIPRFDTFHISNLTAKSDIIAQLYHLDNNLFFSLVALDIKTEYEQSYIPTALSIDAKELSLPTILFKDKGLFYSDDPQDLALNNLGYDKITFSTKFNLLWDKATKELSLNNSSFDVKDMFTIAANIKIKNVNEWLFSGEPAMMAAALTESNLKSFDLKTNLAPLRTRFAAWHKRVGGNYSIPANIDDIYKEIDGYYNIIATQALSNVVSKNPELTIFAYHVAEKLSKAMNAFIMNGGTFEMIFKTKSENGLSLADFIGQKDLSAALLEKIDFSAQVTN